MEKSAELKMGATPEAKVTVAVSRRESMNRFHLFLEKSFQIFKQFWILVVLVVWGAVAYLLITHYVFLSVTVDGHSMTPALDDTGQYWVNRLAYYQGDPRASDIVALKDPRDGTLVVKRIIALPGQSIYIRQGKVYVNSKLLDEPYLVEKTYTFAFEKNPDEFICVGKDEYFVMGDNRGNSTDSRTYGTVPRQNILGKIIH